MRLQTQCHPRMAYRVRWWAAMAGMMREWADALDACNAMTILMETHGRASLRLTDHVMDPSPAVADQRMVHTDWIPAIFVCVRLGKRAGRDTYPRQASASLPTTGRGKDDCLARGAANREPACCSLSLPRRCNERSQRISGRYRAQVASRKPLLSLSLSGLLSLRYAQRPFAR